MQHSVSSAAPCEKRTWAVRDYRAPTPCMPRIGSAHTAHRLRVPPRSGSVHTTRRLRAKHTLSFSGSFLPQIARIKRILAAQRRCISLIHDGLRRYSRRKAICEICRLRQSFTRTICAICEICGRFITCESCILYICKTRGSNSVTCFFHGNLQVSSNFA